MKLKPGMVISVLFSLFPILLFSQSRNETITGFISSLYTNHSLTAGAIDNADIEKILQCGIKAPSARNSQPWHFTVIKNLQIMQQILPDTVEGNIFIVVSGLEKQQGAIFDCGLATENIFLAAQALALGSHIYTGPMAKVNQGYKDKIGIPKDYIAISIVKIGKVEQGVDLVSSASKRKVESDIVNFQ